MAIAVQILASSPELGLYNSEGVIGGGRSALTLAAGPFETPYSSASLEENAHFVFQALSQRESLLAH